MEREPQVLQVRPLPKIDPRKALILLEADPNTSGGTDSVGLGPISDVVSPYTNFRSHITHSPYAKTDLAPVGIDSQKYVARGSWLPVIDICSMLFPGVECEI